MVSCLDGNLQMLAFRGFCWLWVWEMLLEHLTLVWGAFRLANRIPNMPNALPWMVTRFLSVVRSAFISSKGENSITLMVKISVRSQSQTAALHFWLSIGLAFQKAREKIMGWTTPLCAMTIFKNIEVYASPPWLNPLFWSTSRKWPTLIHPRTVSHTHPHKYYLFILSHVFSDMAITWCFTHHSTAEPNCAVIKITRLHTTAI